MIYSLDHIAASRYLDATKFKDYAINHSPKLLTDCGAVTSWDVDALVDGYKAFVGETEYSTDRLKLITKRVIR